MTCSRTGDEPARQIVVVAARALVDELIRQRPDGVTEIVTSARSDNGAVMPLLQRAGTIEDVLSTHGMSEVHVRLRPRATSAGSLAPQARRPQAR